MGKHGYPDWGSEGGPTTTIFSIQDIGELAARLGSIDTFDRRGNIIFLDGFEDGISKWYGWSDGDGGVDWDGNHGSQGGFCLKLFTDPAAWQAARAIRRCPYPVISTIGFEAAVQFDSHVSTVAIHVILYDGVNYHWAYISYDVVTDKLWYFNSTGGATLLEGTVKATTDIFNVMKLVVDFVNDEYVRFIFNNTPVDMAGIGVRVHTDGTAPHLQVYMDIVNKEAVSSILYIDSAISTQNEP